LPFCLGRSAKQKQCEFRPARGARGCSRSAKDPRPGRPRGPRAARPRRRPGRGFPISAPRTPGGTVGFRHGRGGVFLSAPTPLVKRAGARAFRDPWFSSDTHRAAQPAPRQTPGKIDVQFAGARAEQATVVFVGETPGDRRRRGSGCRTTCSSRTSASRKNPREIPPRAHGLTRTRFRCDRQKFPVSAGSGVRTAGRRNRVRGCPGVAPSDFSESGPRSGENQKTLFL